MKKIKKSFSSINIINWQQLLKKIKQKDNITFQYIYHFIQLH